MPGEASRPTLRSYLADSGVPPEKFLEALGILKDEIRALLEEVPSAAAVPPPPDSVNVNENGIIRRILEEIKARWVEEDRAKARAASPPAPPVKSAVPETPPAASPEAGRITMETVILKAPGGARSQPRPPGPPAETLPPPEMDAGDRPTAFIRVEPPPSAHPREAGGEMLLETMVKTSGERPTRMPVPERKEPAAPPVSGDDQPTTFIRVGSPPPQQVPPKPPAKPPEDDEMSQTVIFRPDPLLGKGKGGPK